MICTVLQTQEYRSTSRTTQRDQGCVRENPGSVKHSNFVKSVCLTYELISRFHFERTDSIQV
jgi:hypothetical protein